MKICLNFSTLDNTTEAYQKAFVSPNATGSSLSVTQVSGRHERTPGGIRSSLPGFKLVVGPRCCPPPPRARGLITLFQIVGR